MKKCLLGLLILTPMVVSGQYEAEKFEATLLEAKYGALLVYNGKVNSFSLRFESKSVGPSNQPNFIKVDNFLMQSFITPFTESLDFNNLDKATQKKYLATWTKYEKQWVEEQLQIQVTEKIEFFEISNRVFVYWTYDMPKSNEKGAVDKQVYLVTICFDQLLLLNAPLERGTKEETLKSKFLNIGKTVTLYPGQILDIERMRRELKN